MTSDAAVPLTPWQQELVTSAIPVIDTVARRLGKYASLVGLDEMLAMGRQGLVQAAKSFDAALGVPFATFATYRVQGAMLDGIRKEATRARRIGLAARLAACEVLAIQRDAGDPMTDTEEDQRRRLDVMADGVATAMFVGVVSAASREASEGEDAEIRRQQYARAISALRDASSSLPARDRTLLALHYEQERDLKEVAVALRVSYATVRRHHANVIGKLAVRLRSRGVTEPPSAR